MRAHVMRYCLRYSERPMRVVSRALIISAALGLAVNFPESIAATPVTPSGLNTQVTLAPTPPLGKVQYDITGGTRPGGGVNLFHSFGDFNVSNNNIANFLNETGLPTSNILGRVTGGNLSSIFGTIQTTGFGNANLFLMNPAGFLFGPNATVNVGGMVAFTSADYLRLSDGVRFNAVPDAAADALLSPAPVAAFGFLGSNPGAITVQGSQFTVTDGTGISLVGGNIAIESGTPDGGTAQPAKLIAPNGKIQLASAASPGEFDAATLQALPNVDGASFTSFGSVSLASGSNINISGTNTVSIRGGQFILSVSDAVLSTAGTVGPPEVISLTPTSSIISFNSGADPGADIQVKGGNFQMDGSSIQSLAMGDGPGGNILLDGQTIGLTNGAQIVSSTSGTGTGGNVTVDATESVTISGFDATGTLTGVTTPFIFDPNTGSPAVASGIYSLTSGIETATGGAITITAPTVSLDNNATIATITSGDGNGGHISVNATNASVTSTAAFLSIAGLDFTTFDFVGSGRGGDITISASDTLSVSGSNPDFGTFSQIASFSFSSGRGGDIRISAPNVTLEDLGTISSTNLAGDGGHISITAQDVNLTGGFITTDSADIGTGGNITLSVDNALSVRNSSIRTLSQADGRGGTIDITAESALVERGEGLSGSIETGSFGSSTAGDLRIQVDNNLTVLDGGSIISSGSPTGSSGNIFITAGDTITVSGTGQLDTDTTSRIGNANTFGGASGTLDIEATKILLVGNAMVQSGSLSQGGGGITIHANDFVTLSGGSRIRLDVRDADGGPVNISAPTITIDQSSVRARSAGLGQSGPITLDAEIITISNGQVTSDSASGPGRSGNITVNATDTLYISGQFTNEFNITSPAGIFSQTFAGGPGGTVTVTSPTITVSNGGQIGSSTLSSGNAGTITLSTNDLLLTDAGSGIFSETQGTGLGGSITVNANAVTMTNGAAISSNSAGGADAGSINITANNGLSMQNSSITTEAGQGAGGGNIKITTSPEATVYLQNSKIDASVADGPGGGGNVSIDPQYVILQNSQILAEAANGQGGSISITTGLFLPDATSRVSADSGSGLNGTVTIQSPISQAGGKIQPLGKSPLLSTAMFNQRCAALAGGTFSSFTVGGRETLPSEPGSWLSSPLALQTMSEDKPQQASNEQETPLLSLRQIQPSGFLTQSFAVESSGCQS